MANTTVNLMWIGNRSQLNTPNTTNITQAQASAITGWTAEGKNEIKPVAVGGNYYGSGSGAHFKTTYQGTGSQPASSMTYTNPDGILQSNVKITGFVGARFAVTVHDGAGNASVVQQDGVIIQMSNGDMFFRPSTATLNAWNSITSISKITVLSANALENTVATIGFKANIFEAEIVCFVRGTMIECADGLRAVERLQVGDMVRTLDNGLKPLRWIASQRLTSQLTTDPKLRPICIGAGALRQGVPLADLMVSPQHRILVRSKIAARLFGASEVLVAAKQLLAIDGVKVASELEEVEYFHFAFEQHEIVLANGAETESLYPGPQALRAIGEAAREELFAIFPNLREQRELPISARQLASGRQARSLAARHAHHGRPLVADCQF